MTKEEITKLQKIQNDIDAVENSLNYVRQAKRIRIIIPHDGINDNYYIPMEKIPDLEAQVKYLITEMIEERLDDLTYKRDTLILCTKQESETIYKPTNLE